MPDNTSNNKRVAKNTLMLYLRMFVTMAIGLYTSRVILQTLGVSDYGVYNVVGGFVAMLSYLNTVFVGATQRFIVFTLGENDPDKLKRLFKSSITVHFIIGIIILIVAETFGLWFVNNKLNIDADRMVAANWVYQCSVLSLILTMINIPYRSCVVAHEHMHLYAYVSIVESVLKLGIVFLLLIIPGDKLIIYSILMLLIMIVVPVWYIIYCRRFDECSFGFGFDKGMIKEMGSYAGWLLVGNLGFSFKDQFSNIIMNLFLGTSINAARGVAAQVNSIITSFADNFTMALNPQITKHYAAGEIEQSQELVYSGARYAFFLMAMIAIPVIMNIDYILELWLGVVPEYTSQFVVITIVASLFYSISKTTTTAIQATGDIKWFQIGISIIMLLELPAAFVLLKLQYPPYYALMPAIATSVMGLIFRFFILKKQVPSYSIKYYFINIVLRSVSIMCLSFAISYLLCSMLEMNFWTFLLSSFLSVIVSATIIYFMGLTGSERNLLKKYLYSKMHYNHAK